MRKFCITITTSHPDASEIVRGATEKIACELDWGAAETTSIEAVALPDYPNDTPEYLAGWEMEPE